MNLGRLKCGGKGEGGSMERTSRFGRKTKLGSGTAIRREAGPGPFERGANDNKRGGL